MEWVLQKIESGAMALLRASHVFLCGNRFSGSSSPCWGRSRYTSACPDDDRCDACVVEPIDLVDRF